MMKTRPRITLQVFRLLAKERNPSGSRGRKTGTRTQENRQGRTRG